MTDKYVDPTDAADILESIKTMPTLGEIVKKMDELYPDWIIGILPRYSRDYPSLQENWVDICEENEVECKKIILVRGIFFDDDHTLLRTFSEVLTISGFCVRSYRDLFPCNKCGLALPQSHLYDLLKDKGEDIPDVWSVLCIGCE